MYRITVTHSQSENNVVEKMSLQGLSEDVGDGWVTKLQGKSIPGQRMGKTPVNQTSM